MIALHSEEGRVGTVKVQKITVCGGGNGAQTLVPIAAQNLGCPVDVFAPLTGEVERLQAGVTAHGGIEVTGALQCKAQPRRISADPTEVIPGSKIVVLVLPAFAHESVLLQIAPFLCRGAWVGAIPARGGFDYCAAHILKEQGREDVSLFGLQTLPWACRIRVYGQVVHVIGAKKVVDAATRPATQVLRIVPLLEQMLGLPIAVADNMLALSLANTGQLIHPGIMHGLFADWDGTPFSAEEVPLFYQGLSEEAAQTLAGLSDDVQAIRARLEPSLGLSNVHPLKAWLLRAYGDAISDPSSLRTAFATNRAYAGLKAPVRKDAAGEFVPDFGARYLSEDVPFGLAVSQAIAAMAGVKTPTMDEVIAWAGARLGKDYLGQDACESRIPQKYGLMDLEHLIAFATDT